MFTTIITVLEQSKYFLLFAGSYIEGSAAMMTGGLLARLGIVSFGLAYLALFLGDVLSDLMWYLIGRFAARSFFVRYGKFIGATPDILEKVERKFHQHEKKILVTSKLTMGLGLAVPVLITAGMMRVRFVTYATINILGSFVWIFFLMCIGYYFGNVLDYIPENLKIAAAIATPFIFFYVMHLLTEKLKKANW
jgi:membrane protein DedA with SNARE-associated domain